MNATADIDRLAGVLPLASIIPFPDLLLGGVLLVAVVLIHGIGIRLVSVHFRKRSDALARRVRPSLRLDALLGVVIFLLLALHLSEVVFWTAALVYSRLVEDWRTAAFFAANTYTTVGYGKFVLPAEWSMMSPIISISGLFTFGWTGSVLVGFVTSLDRLRDRQTMNAADKSRSD
jgi:hypothetical protein